MDINWIIGKIEEIKEYKYYIECYKHHISYSNNKIKKCKKCRNDIYKLCTNIFYENNSYESFLNDSNCLRDTKK